MTPRKKPRFERQDSVFIDPENSGSTIQWIVQYTGSGSRYLTVTLRDCDRKITWSADEHNGDFTRQARDKLQKAIDSLQGALAAVESMEKLHPRRKPRVKK